MNLSEIQALISTNTRYSSLDAPLTDSDDSGNLYEVTETKDPSPEYELLVHSLKSDISRLLNSLPSKEGEVIRLFFGINEPHALSLDEISIKLGLTRERVRQLKERGIRKLRHNSKSRHLKAYLEL